MNLRKFIFICFCFLLSGCLQYHSPSRDTWNQYLYGASFMDMTETARTAKMPVYMGHGGKIVTKNGELSKKMQYGDKNEIDNTVLVNYMSNLEYELYDALRKPGISVQRAGTDVVIILVRDAIMEQGIADISQSGDDTLKTISKILNKYDATFMEIAGYTDSMNDKNAAYALSLDILYHPIKCLHRCFIKGINFGRTVSITDSC